jgi:hypothetical protein
MTLKQAYALISKVASPSANEGLKKPKAILLLWYLRNVMGVDDLEAYEYICDGDNDKGVDSLYLISKDSEEKDTLIIFQSKYPDTAKNVGENEIRSFVGSIAPFRNSQSLQKLVNSKLEPELLSLIERFDIQKKLENDSLKIRLIFVTAGELTKEARELIESHNTNEGKDFLIAHDALYLAPIIEAFTSPSTVKAKVTVTSPANERFITNIGSGKIAVCAVKAKDIVCWPGIDDRKLFDLNVRRELTKNRVRKALDRSLQKPSDHMNFLAFHNGLTVICEELDDSKPDKLVITNMSVVNGAQSTIAFKANEASLTDNLKIVVKFVEVGSENQVAREVAVRSNMQNPVNARNLRARDGIQLRLEAEFKKYFPKIYYETRPDYSNPSENHTIPNDFTAQLLCSLYSEKPWLAVKRLVLFESENYPTIFTQEITAHHVVLADLINSEIQLLKSEFPESYQGSWQLTRIIAVYLVGQLLRTNDENRALLEHPKIALAKSARTTTEKTIKRLVRFAIAAMKVRHDLKLQEGEFDDFKVDFKREATILELRAKARESYLTYTTVEGT